MSTKAKTSASANGLVAIEKGIPVPSGQRGKYPWKMMEVGDSFVIPIKKRAGMTSLYERYSPKKFITRKVNEDGVEKIRVWRVE